LLDYDPPLTDEEQDRVDELIDAEIVQTTETHPFLANLSQPPEPSPLWAAEYERIAQGKPLTGIDPQRYQISATDVKANLVATEYLTNRSDNLALLEAYGSNSWLIGNSIQENALGVLEQELARLKEEGVRVNRERKGQNLELGAEIDKLDQRWRKALRGLVEVEIACAGLEEEARELQSRQ